MHHSAEDAMNLSYLVVHLLVAIACAGIANILIPRQIPGKMIGFILTGWVGVWIGVEAHKLLWRQYGLNLPWLNWGFNGIPVLPSIIGCAIVIFVITSFLKWSRYS
jgi:uncharacterized membrane protein YeaQ/YmgE (transglycosylase-associated protein family)